MKRIDSFLDAYEKYAEEHCPPLRRGQALMNFLYRFDRDAYNNIRLMPSENLDCFYVDDRIDSTISYLNKIWSYERDD